MYDWANSVFTLVVATAVFPIYYYAVTPDVVGIFGTSVPAASLRSYTISAAYVLIALTSPYLGGLADARRLKKRFLAACCYTGAASAAGLYFFVEGHTWLGLGLFMLGSYCYALSDNFYNAFLPEVATPDRFDGLSARGYSLGYLGSSLLLMACLALIQLHETVGVSEGYATRLAFVLVGVWWAGFGWLSLQRLRERGVGTPGGSGWAALRRCLVQLKDSKLVRRFLLTFFLYNMGIQTIIQVAADFGTEVLGLEASDLILTILAIQFVAVGGAYLFAMLTKRLGPIRALQLAVVCWLAMVGYAYTIDSAVEFYALGGGVGLLLGATQSVSRATYARFLPKAVREEGNASFFSFYNILDKVSIIFGTLVFGLTVNILGTMRPAVLVLSVFFLLGLVLLAASPWAKWQSHEAA